MVLSESVIHSRMVGNLTILQDTYSSVVIQTSNLEPWRESTDMMIKGNLFLFDIAIVIITMQGWRLHVVAFCSGAERKLKFSKLICNKVTRP